MGGQPAAGRHDDQIRDSETVVVLSGDHPVVSSEAIAGLLAVHRDADAGATVMTAVLEEPGSYGRIVRDPDSGDLAEIDCCWRQV